MTGVNGAIFWLIVAVILFVIEGATVQLVTMWFAFGSIFAMITSALGAPVWIQLLVFLIFSILFLFIFRPLLKTRLKVKKEPTNADRVIGQTGVVLETIDNIAQTGRVSANGLDWTARARTDDVIERDERVLVHAIDGVKLIVERAESRQEQRSDD